MQTYSQKRSEQPWKKRTSRKRHSSDTETSESNRESKKRKIENARKKKNEDKERREADRKAKKENIKSDWKAQLEKASADIAQLSVQNGELVARAIA